MNAVFEEDSFSDVHCFSQDLLEFVSYSPWLVSGWAGLT